MTDYAPELTPYNTQVQAAGNHTENLVAKVATLALGLGAVRSVAGGSAADFQHMASGMAAASRVTNQSFGQLSSGVRQLQQDFPLASQAAYETVRAVQSLGLTAKNQVGQVSALSNVMVKLAGATGSGAPAQLAQSFGMLNREMASLDPARVQRFGDSLTTLSARSGTSAQGIVSFAQSISPFAQAAGVGETALLGISTAFSKLGNDGYVAANTVNTMFSDLTRSVREGGNQMAAYANILGTTTKHFREMYAANPADVIGQVTERIGTAGPAGSRMLESIGIEGIRGQRALLLAAQSGGLRSEIAQAERAYGSGSTANAAAAAYGGVTDQLTKLGNASQQVAEAFERPLLHSVSRIVDATATIPRGVAGVVGSRPVQDVLGITGQIGVPLIMARLLMRGVGLAAAGTYLGGSGPVRGFLGGIRQGQYGGDYEAAARSGGFLSRAGMPFYTAQREGTALGSTMMAPINARALALGASLGGFMGQGVPGPGIFGMAGRYGLSAVGMSLRYHSEIARLAQLGPLERDAMRVRGFSSPMQAAADRFQTSREALAAGTITRGEHFENIQDSMRRLNTDLKGMSLASLTWQEGVRGSASMIGQYSRFAMGAVGMGVRGIASMAMSPMGLITGGLLAYQAYRGHEASQHAEDQRVQGLSIYDTLNQYRDAMGQAGEATMTLAQQMQNAANVVNRIGSSSFHTATTVTSRDIGAAGTPNRDKATTIYRGTNAQIAGQVSALNLNGLSNQDLQAIKMDMLRQGLPPDRINDILSQVSQGGSQGQLTGAEISGLVGGVATSAGGYSMSVAERQKRSMGKGSVSGTDWREIGGKGIGGTPLVGADGKKILDRLQDSVMQQYANLTTAYGQGYAVNKQVRTAQQIMQRAIATGNADTVAAVGQRLSTAMAGHKINTISAQELRDANGNIAQVLADRGEKVYGHDLSYWQQHGNMRRQNLQSGDYVMMRDAGATALTPYFNAINAPGYASGVRTQRLALSAMSHPDDLAKQTKAVDAIVNSATAAGTSLAELAKQATKAGGAFTDNSPQQQMMARILSETQFRMQTNLAGATRAQNWQQTAAFALGQAQTNGNSQFAQQQRAQGRETLQSTRADMISYYQQRLAAQMQYQIASTRAQEDYQLQVARSEQDFYINRQRALEDYNIQQQREREDAAKTLYDPYTRIQAMPVWDAVNLADNSQTQIQAMRQQISNLNKLRSLGMDDATIQMLGLYSPDKAQEVSQLVGDLQNHPRELATLNRQTAVRTRLAGQLISQDPQYKRQREDFNRSMERQQADFQRMSDRAHDDYLKSQRRMAEDVHNQDLEMTNDLKDLQKGMNQILHGQFVDFSNIVEQTMRHTLHTVNHWVPRITHGLNTGAFNGGSPTTGSSGTSATGSQQGGGYGNAPVGGSTTGTDSTLAPGGQRRQESTGSPSTKYVAPGSGTVYNAPFGTDLNSSSTRYAPSGKFQRKNKADPGFNQSIARKMMPAWSTGKLWQDWVTLWNNESGWNQYSDNPTSPAYGIPQADPGSKMSSAGPDWRTNPATQIKWGIGHIKGYGDPSKALAFWDRTDPRPYPGHWYAKGGIATGPHIGMVAEAGSPEAMIPLNEHGVGFLARALGQYLSEGDAAMLSGGGGRAYALHIDHSTHHYDNRVDFRGSEVKVESSDPEEMARKLEQRSRTANMTKARGVTWR